MPIIKVVTKPTFGSIELTPEFKQHLAACGHKGPFSIDARTDSRIHDFIEDETKKVAVHSYTRLAVRKVDTSRQWTISDYDGSESIVYPGFKMVRPDMNYVEEVRE